MKFIYELLRLIWWTDKNPDSVSTASDTIGSIFGFIVGLVIVLIICAMLAAIPAIIAKTFFEKTDERCLKIFWGSFAVIVILTILVGC